MRYFMCLAAMVSATGVLSGCAHSDAHPPTFFVTPRPEDFARQQKVLAGVPSIEEYVEREFRKRGLPNLSIGVVAGGRLVWGRGLGVRDTRTRDPVDADTVFRVGSITKVFTGTALLALRDAGQLSLDAPAAKYLPELDGVVYPTLDSAPITVRHLVTHTSGLPRLGGLRYDDGHELREAEILGLLKGLKLESSPGVKASYSNLGMALAGLIVGRVSGEPYRDYLTKHVLAPLGMTASSFDAEAIPPGKLALGFSKQKDGYHVVPALWRLGAGEAMGGLYSSVADMAKFMAFELAAWPARDEPDTGPLRRSSLREAQSVAGFAPAGKLAFGVNFVIMDDPKVGRIAFHNGSTEEFSASMWLLPDDGVGIVALSGTTDFGGLDDFTHGALLLVSGALHQPAHTPASSAMAQ